MRQRIEDLGRITVLLEFILDMPLFEDREFRNKEFIEYLDQLSDENREDVLHALPYNIDEVKEKLYEALEIAKGIDELNLNEE